MSVTLSAGTSSYLDKGGALSPAPSGDSSVTLACWVRFSSLTAFTWVMGDFNASGNDYNAITLNGGSTVLDFYVSKSGTFYTVSQGAIATSTWYHVAMTWDGSTVTAYVNGTSIGTIAGAPTGRAAWGNFGFGNCDGSIQDGVRYSAALSAPEIVTLFGARNPKRRANLTCHYPMLPGTNRIIDWSGNGNTLTSHGSPGDGAEAPVGWGGPLSRVMRPLTGALTLGAGTAAAASAASANIAMVVAEAANADAASAADGLISVAQAIAATAAASSSATGGISLSYGLTGTAAGASAATAPMLVTVSPLGAAPAASAATAALSVARGVSGAADAATAADAGIAVARGLVGAAAAGTAATAGMAMDMLIGAGTAAASSAATAALGVAKPLGVGDAPAASAATAVMTVAKALIGVAASGTAADSALNVVGFSAQSASRSAVAATVQVAQAHTGVVASGTSATASMSLDVQLAGNADCGTNATATEEIFRGLTNGTVACGSSATGHMTVTVALVGTAANGTAANAFTSSAPLPQQFIRVPVSWRPTVIRLREGDP